MCPGWEALTGSLKVSGNAWARALLQSGDVSSQASADSKVAEPFYLGPSVLLFAVAFPNYCHLLIKKLLGNLGLLKRR